MNKNAFHSQIVSILFLLAIIHSTPSYTSIYQNYCSTPSTLTANVNTYQLINSRSSEAGFSFQISNLVSAVNGNGSSGLVSDIGAYIILMAIMTIFMIVTFFFFLGFCCCYDRASEPNESCAQVCTGVAVLFLLGFIGLFIVMIVYLGIMNYYLNSAVCAIGRIPYDLLNGVTAPSVNFIGFNNMTYIVGNFSNQLGNMASLESYFMNIYNQNLPGQTTTALASLSNFYQIYRNKTTSDGFGNNSQPLVIQALTPNINSLIQNEFNTFNYAATQLNVAAVAGMAIAFTPGSNASYQSSMNQINVQLNSIISVLSGTIANITTGIATAVIYSPVGYWITLGFGILVIICSITVSIWVCLSYRNRRDTCRWFSKIFLVANSLLIIILGLLAIALLIASTVVTSVCKQTPNILSQNGVGLVSLLTGWGFNLNSTTKNILTNCLATDATGSIISVIDSADPIVNAGINFLDGIVAYNSVKPNLTSQGTFSYAINATVAYWNNLATGIIADQLNAVNNLNQLNSLTRCGGVTYQLNSANCTSSQCIGIYNATNVNISACASGSSAAAIYNNIKQYLVSEFSLLSSMISSLNSQTDTHTPNYLQTIYRQGMITVLPDFNTIVNTVGGFLASIPATSGGLLENVNCTILQNEVLNVESAVCFNFNNPLYYFTSLLAFIVFFFSVFSWSICCALRFIPVEDEILPVVTEMAPDLQGFTPEKSEREEINPQNPKIKI